MSANEFSFSKAVREQVPILIGLVGPSGTGKTFSALRLAVGIQRVTGGRIKVIDTEHKRSKHYSDRFDFDWLNFGAPFSSLRYLKAIQEAAQTPGPVIVDSLSHEHDGPGGYLETHEEEVQRLIKSGGFKNEYAASVPAWAKPAEYRRKLIQGIIHLGINAIFCFRAKEKVDMNAKKPDGSKTVGKLGWMPIAGDAFVYEMTMKCLLLPGADGVPSWHPEELGEKAMCKLPIQFREMFKPGVQLSEEIGQRLAEWAAGSDASSAVGSLVNSYSVCATMPDFDDLEKQRQALWKTMKAADQKKTKAASDDAKKRLESKPVMKPDEQPRDELSGKGDAYEGDHTLDLPGDGALFGQETGVAH